MSRRGRLLTRAVVCLALVGVVPTSVAAQRAAELRSAVAIPARVTAGDAVRSGRLPRAVKGAVMGGAIAATVGAALSLVAHNAYCGETRSCDDWPDRGFRESVLYGGMVGAALGFLIGLVTAPAG